MSGHGCAVDDEWRRSSRSTWNRENAKSHSTIIWGGFAVLAPAADGHASLRGQGAIVTWTMSLSHRLSRGMSPHEHCPVAGVLLQFQYDNTSLCRSSKRLQIPAFA